MKVICHVLFFSLNHSSRPLCCETKVLHPAGRGLRRTNRRTKYAAERHGSRLPKLQGRVEVLVPDKRRFATRQQWANTKKPTTEEVQVMPENVRHYRKFTTEMLRKLDNLENSPNITGEVKATTAVDRSDHPFGARIHTETTPS